MAKTITREKLKERLDRGDQFVFVNVLLPQAFERVHIPGSINVPVTDIERRAPELWPDKNTDIVVYCASFDCNASPVAAWKLEQMGYTNVTDYEGGLRDWREAGHPLEIGKAAA